MRDEGLAVKRRKGEGRRVKDERPECIGPACLHPIGRHLQPLRGELAAAGRIGDYLEFASAQGRLARESASAEQRGGAESQEAQRSRLGDFAVAGEDTLVVNVAEAGGQELNADRAVGPQLQPAVSGRRA